MSGDVDQWLAFCRRLHDHLTRALGDVGAVRTRVESLLSQNSFLESCFCKGCVLPVVDTVVTEYLTAHGAAPCDIRRSLRCEGFDTPMYACSNGQVGFSSHSRSNSYHPGDKSGRRTQSRRSPDFCIRFQKKLRMAGELKYVAAATPSTTAQVARELRDYLSIAGEPTSDWGHDFDFGLIYGRSGDGPRNSTAILDYWSSDRIFISRIA